MRGGRSVVALLDICRTSAYSGRAPLPCYAFAILSSKMSVLTARTTTTTAGAVTKLDMPLSHQTRCLHLSSVIRNTAETPAASTTTNTNTTNTTNTTTSSSSSSFASGATALDIAMRVNKLKRLHQTGGGPDGKKRIELDAWTELNSLTEEQINSAEGKAVSLLLNSWAYFAKYWEKGKDGPLGAAASQFSSQSETEGGAVQPRSE